MMLQSYGVAKNDVNKNETSIAPKHLKGLINHRSNTNIKALAAPRKHDLERHHALIMKFKCSIEN
jgi:predicted negative regulator of RcsB-dependent stress response